MIKILIKEKNFKINEMYRAMTKVCDLKKKQILNDAQNDQKFIRRI